MIENNQQMEEDVVNSPKHYRAGSVEVIQIIEEQALPYHLGNVVKYICRSGKKTPDPLEDLKKAQWYLNRYIAILEAERSNSEIPHPANTSTSATEDNLRIITLESDEDYEDDDDFNLFDDGGEPIEDWFDKWYTRNVTESGGTLYLSDYEKARDPERVIVKDPNGEPHAIQNIFFDATKGSWWNIQENRRATSNEIKAQVQRDSDSILKEREELRADIHARMKKDAPRVSPAERALIHRTYEAPTQKNVKSRFRPQPHF